MRNAVQVRSVPHFGLRLSLPPAEPQMSYCQSCTPPAPVSSWVDPKLGMDDSQTTRLQHVEESYCGHPAMDVTGVMLQWMMEKSEVSSSDPGGCPLSIPPSGPLQLSHGPYHHTFEIHSSSIRFIVSSEFSFNNLLWDTAASASQHSSWVSDQQTDQKTTLEVTSVQNWNVGVMGCFCPLWSYVIKEWRGQIH